MSHYSFSARKKSIHIVIFTGGEHPAPADCAAYWARHPFDCVIAADSGLDAAKEFNDYYFGEARSGAKKSEGKNFNKTKRGANASGASCADFDVRRKIDFTPDFVLGDFDSLSDTDALSAFPTSSVERFSADKDFTDTELALMKAHKIAAKKEARPFITLVGGGAGRLDHLLSIYDSFATEKRANVWLLPREAVYFVEAETCTKITSLKKDDIISVVRTTAAREGGAFSASGLRWNEFMKRGMPSLSNRILDEGKVATVSADVPFLLIVPIDADVRVG